MTGFFRTVRRRGGEGGFILAGVVLIMLVLAIMIPLMVMYTDREANWSVKQDKSTKAFHLAEAGVEKAYRALSLSTGTWYNLIEHGTQIDDFKFDHTFDDLAEGVYAVHIASGPGKWQATVKSVGKVAYGGNRIELRGIEVVFQQTALGDIAIESLSGVYMNGNNIDVRWGAVLSRDEINLDARTSPQFWAAGQIIKYTSTKSDQDPNPPNCDEPDCVQWHSFSTEIPPDPGIDIDFYRSSATSNTNGCPPVENRDTGDPAVQDPAGSCRYTEANVTVTGDYNATAGTIFFEGNVWTDKIYLKGSVIILGNLVTRTGNSGEGTVSMKMPQTAWKQYGRDWATYQGYDNYADDNMPSFPGLDSTYLSDINYTKTESKVYLNGFMYVGGDMYLGNGGGSCTIYGSIYCVGKAYVDSNSQMDVYYNKDAAEDIHTLKIILSRVSWKAIVHQWPSAL